MLHRITYGKRQLPIDIPEDNLAFAVGPKEVDIARQGDEMIRETLLNPIGTPPLSDLVTPGQTVAVIVDDHTRLTPTHRILPYLLDELNRGGVPDADIQIIIASGTHRAMTKAEKVQKLGDAVMGRVVVRDHEYLNREKLLDFGTTDHGTHILVNADAIQADIRLVVGTIFPHFPAGWSAGAKMLLPGIAGEETVAQFHMLGASHPDTQLGQIDTITRREMESFAARVGLHFIFNVVLDKHGRLLRCFAGDYVKAHRAGVAFARQVYEVAIGEPADLVISSTSPIDHDYFQVMKGLYSAEVCARPGGEIMVVSPLYEGMAVTHLEALQVTPLAMDVALDRIRKGDYQDMVGAAIATYQIKLCARFKLSVVSEFLSEEHAQLLGVRLYSDPDSLQAVIDSRLQLTPNLKIGILHQSTEVVPTMAG